MWSFLDSINAILLPGLNFILEAFPFLRNMPGKPGRLFKTVVHARDKCLQRFVVEAALKVDEVTETEGLVYVFLKMRKIENEKAVFELIDELLLLRWSLRSFLVAWNLQARPSLICLPCLFNIHVMPWKSRRR